MKKLYPLALLILLLLMADRLCYYLYNYIYEKQENNEIAFKRDALRKTNHNLFVLGSSRANHHYDTRILDSLLHVHSFNMGDERKKLSYQLPIADIVFSNPSVETVILDVLPYELGLYTPMSENQSLLMFAHTHPSILNYFNDESLNTSLLVKLKSYYFNSQTFSLFVNFFSGKRAKISQQMNSFAGYLPLKGKFKEKFFPDTSTTTNKITEEQFNSIIQISKKHNKKLYVVISPFLPEFSALTENKIREIALSQGIPFISYADSIRYKDKVLYVDPRHLNEKGAAMFTQSLCNIILNNPVQKVR